MSVPAVSHQDRAARANRTSWSGNRSTPRGGLG